MKGNNIRKMIVLVLVGSFGVILIGTGFLPVLPKAFASEDENSGGQFEGEFSPVDPEEISKPAEGCAQQSPVKDEDQCKKGKGCEKKGKNFKCRPKCKRQANGQIKPIACSCLENEDPDCAPIPGPINDFGTE